MNNQQAKKQVAIPGFVWAIAVILVLCILFLFLVQSPFSKKIGPYNAEHESAQSQINMYEDYLSRADQVEAYIAEMKEKYNEESTKLFINASESPADIKEMVNKLDIELNSLNISEGGVDGQGRTSSTGDNLYVTSVSLNFEGTTADLLSTLDYFELESDGSYYVENLSVIPTSAAENVTADEERYNISMSLSLYYFPPKVEEVSTSPVVSGSAAVASVEASSASSASSAA